MIKKEKQLVIVQYNMTFSNPAEFSIPRDLLVGTINLYGVVPDGKVDNHLGFTLAYREGGKLIVVPFEDYEKYLLTGDRCVRLDTMVIPGKDIAKKRNLSDGGYEFTLWPPKES